MDGEYSNEDDVFNSEQSQNDVNDRTLEQRFVSCKEKIGGDKGWAVCAFLNPKISAKRRSQLKSKMIKKRKASGK